jgi:hypothetical protein
MSKLRDRIAAALYRHVGKDSSFPQLQMPWEEAFPIVRGHWLGMADAVIAALQLQPEYGHLDETDSGIIADTIPELGEPCPGETLRHRYITPWKDINETD